MMMMIMMFKHIEVISVESLKQYTWEAVKLNRACVNHIYVPLVPVPVAVDNGSHGTHIPVCLFAVCCVLFVV